MRFFNSNLNTIHRSNKKSTHTCGNSILEWEINPIKCSWARDSSFKDFYFRNGWLDNRKKHIIICLHNISSMLKFTHPAPYGIDDNCPYIRNFNELSLFLINGYWNSTLSSTLIPTGGDLLNIYNLLEGNKI